MRYFSTLPQYNGARAFVMASHSSVPSSQDVSCRRLRKVAKTLVYLCGVFHSRLFGSLVNWATYEMRFKLIVVLYKYWLAFARRLGAVMILLSWQSAM